MKYTLITDLVTADVTYRRGKLAVVEVKKGTFDFELLGMLIPALEKHVDKRDMLPHENKQRNQFYQPALQVWNEFYEKRAGIPYRVTAADGQSLVQIGNFLDNLGDGKQGAIELWQQMLSGWDRLEPFFRDNLDLRFINGQLNKIINQLKNGQHTGNKARHDSADDIRRRFSGGGGA